MNVEALHGYGGSMSRPQDLAIDLLRRGYAAIPHLREDAGASSAVSTKLLGRSCVVVSGHGAVRDFYDPDLIRRGGAVPAPLSRLLFGAGAIHGLDGARHLHRKSLFLDLLDTEAAVELGELAREEVRTRVHADAGKTCRIFDQLVDAYGAAAIKWTGVEPVDPGALSRRLARIVDGFGGAGPAYLRGWAARARVDQWARRQVRTARAHPGSFTGPLSVIARWRDERGRLLPVRVAATELVNVLRPIVAVAYLGAFAVCALDEFPDWKDRLAPGGAGGLRRMFANEVRRTSPFVPALVGKANRDRAWDGQWLRGGRRVVLDVPGTNHDPHTWATPDRFDPERFVDRPIGRDDLVAQGGGDPGLGHRCPGEEVTVAVLAATLEVFANAEWVMAHHRHDFSRIPAREDAQLRLAGDPVTTPLRAACAGWERASARVQTE